MDSPEMRSHSFVIKIEVDTKERWHGYISHVPEGRRSYFQRLGEIPLFVAPYLKDLGIDLGPGWTLWRWLYSLGQKRILGDKHG